MGIAFIEHVTCVRYAYLGFDLTLKIPMRSWRLKWTQGWYVVEPRFTHLFLYNFYTIIHGD